MTSATLDLDALKAFYLELWRRSPAGYSSRLSEHAGTPVPRHLRYLSDRIVDAVGGQQPRLIVSMPPRHGKSYLSSIYTPIWFLDTFPERRVILVSYEATYAASYGRRVRDLIDAWPQTLRVRVSKGSSAADAWDTTEGGGMVTAGVGGPITGRGANLLIVDDPIKNAEEAQSEVMRDKLWEWWLTTARTRLEPDAPVLMVLTRWHEDDIVGRLLKAEAEGGEHWEVIRFPALAEAGGDVLGRREGEALWPERYDEHALAETRATILASDGKAAWEALFQQRPTGASGSKFKREWIRRYDQVDPLWPRVMAIDLAGKTATSDRTAIAVLAVNPKASPRPGEVNDTYLVEMLAGRWDAGEFERALSTVVANHRPQRIDVEVFGYQSSLIQLLRRHSSWPLREAKPDKAKGLRADPVAWALESGHLYLPPSAPWLDDFERELLAFPNGTNDDQVDALVYAWRAAQEVRPYVGAAGSTTYTATPRQW